MIFLFYITPVQNIVFENICIYEKCSINLHLNNNDIYMETKTKRERFEKVAGNRVQKIIDFLTLLQNCSNRNNYEYTEADVEHMFTEIQKILKETRSKFQSELNKASKTGFQFNS